MAMTNKGTTSWLNRKVTTMNADQATIIKRFTDVTNLIDLKATLQDMVADQNIRTDDLQQSLHHVGVIDLGSVGCDEPDLDDDCLLAFDDHSLLVASVGWDFVITPRSSDIT